MTIQIKESLNSIINFPEFWDYFLKISTIPRCSSREEKIRDYIMTEANNLGFSSTIDHFGNLVIKIVGTGTEESNLNLVCQCHLDMVCEKEESKKFDFLKDPIPLKIINVDEFEWLSAEGTTLGADNGVGICYLLTLMKKIHSKELSFPGKNLYLIFTVQEEIGLIGAINFDKSLIKGKYFINLDGDSEKFIIGCAGGITTKGMATCSLNPVENQLNNPKALKIGIHGLKGGHSGVDIDKNRANAIKLLSKILWELNNNYFFCISLIQGGKLGNAIPREAQALLYFEEKDMEEIVKFIKSIQQELESEIKNLEPKVQFIIEVINDPQERGVLPRKIKEKLIYLLYIFPHGIISMHPKITNLVHTSTNLASIECKNGKISILTTQRSFNEKSKRQIYQEIEALLKLADMNFEISHKGEYPGWEPSFDSKLLNVAIQTHEQLYKEKPEIQAIHAGLECGIFKKHFPEIELISIGTDIKELHSPGERLNIQDVKRTWDFFIQLLKNLE
ncbi:MAG: beta-Ala-His dipeptidase [Promethearchaeota archaeon]